MDPPGQGSPVPAAPSVPGGLSASAQLAAGTAAPAPPPPQPTAPAPQPARPFLSSAEQSLFPNSLPVRHTLPNIHSFSASAATSPPVPVAQQQGQGSPYGAQRPAGAQQRGYSGAGSPYGNLPTAPPHTTPTPPIIPAANSPPVPASTPSATAPTAAAASPTTAPSAPSAQPAQPATASLQPAAASPKLGQQQPAAGQAEAGGARGNPMSVSSMLSGPPRHPPVSAYSSIPSSLPSSSASPAAPVTAPQPPVLPPPASTAAAQDKPAGSAASPPLNPPTLPGFVQGGVKPPTGTAAPPPLAATPAAEKGKDEQHPPTSRSGSAYPPLPSAFARENPYSPAAAPAPASAAAGSGTASPAQQQQQQAKAFPSPAAAAAAAPLAPGAPQSAQAAATIKNSFFPSLGSYRPGQGQAAAGGGAKPAAQNQQTQQQQTFAAPQYPWQQAHLAGGYGGLAGKDKPAQPGQQHQQRPAPAVAAASPAAARPANGPGHPPSPGKGQQPAIQQQKPAQARFSSLFADGPFGGRNGAPPPTASPSQTAVTAGGPGANGAGVKRRRSDAAEQGQAGAAAGHHHHHHHHAHAQHHHVHQHHPSHTHVSHAQIPMPQLGSHAAPAHQAQQQQQAQAGLPPLPGSSARPPALAAGGAAKPASLLPAGTPPPAPAAPSTPPLPPPPPFTYADLRKATIHPPLVEVLNAAVDAVMPEPELERERERERPFLGRVVYDPLVEPARLLDGEVLKAGVGGTVEVFVPTSWLLRPPPAPSACPSLSSAPAAETDLADVRLSCSRPPSNPHPVALAFGPPSLYSGAPLPLCPSNSLLSLPPHLTDLPSLRKRKVWGTDVYTDDSDVLAVLLHAGWVRVGRRERRKRAGERGAGEEALKRALLPGEPPRPAGNGEEAGQEEEGKESVPKALKVTLGVCPPLVRYQGLERQGVRSRSWGNGHDGVSLRVEKVEGVESLPPPPAHRSRKPSSLAFARQLAQQRQAHYDLHGHAHHDASEGNAFEPEPKRYRFSIPSLRVAQAAAGEGEGEGEVMQHDGAEEEGGKDIIEVTDTFVLDIRSGVGRFVYPEDEDEEDVDEEFEGEEGSGMEVDAVRA